MVTRVAECALCSGTAQASSIVHLDLQGSEYDIPICAAHEGVARALFAPALDKKDFPKLALWSSGGESSVRKLSEKKPKATVSKKRSVGRPPKAQTAVKAARKSSKLNLSEVRDWAWNKGYEVGERGRIPADIIEAFQQTKK